MVKIQGVHTLKAHWWTERGATLAWHTKLSLLLSLCAKRQECFNCCVFASSWVDTFRELSNYWACLQPFTNTCGSLLVVKSLSGPPTEEIAFPLFADWSAKYLQNQIWAFGKISDAVHWNAKLSRSIRQRNPGWVYTPGQPFTMCTLDISNKNVNNNYIFFVKMHILLDLVVNPHFICLHKFLFL